MSGEQAAISEQQEARSETRSFLFSLLASHFSLIAVCLGFVGLAALFLYQTLFTGRVLLPADNLYAYPPWDRYAAQFGISIPHNELLSDAVLQNYVWKKFVRDALAGGQIPFWNPYILAGEPFLAPGQAGVLYPLGLVFLVAPLAQAYSLYTALHLALAGIFTFAFLRAIGSSRFGAAVSGITFAFSGFMVVSFIWPMVIGVAVWLPLALLAAEKLIRLIAESEQRTANSEQALPISNQQSAISPQSPAGARLIKGILWAVVFASALGVQFLAGHMEISGYLLATTGFYVAGRLIVASRHNLSQVRPGLGSKEREARSEKRPSTLLAIHHSLLASLLLAGLVVVAAALAAPQLLPFGELAGQSFRASSVTYGQVVGWAYRPAQLVAFLMPDFFGNPTHHSYLDLLAAKEVAITANSLGEPVQSIFWGAKNYIEGAGYVGILPLLLAALALLIRRDRYTWLFALLAMLSLALAFGTPVYGPLYSEVPGYNQLHTPFRWVFPYSFAVAVLAGLSASAVVEGRPAVRIPGKARMRAEGSARAIAIVAGLALGGGFILAAGLAAALPIGGPVFDLAQSVVQYSSALRHSFPDGRAFFFYEFRNFGLLALLLMASGALLTLLLFRRDRLVKAGALALIAADLFYFGMGFNTASDPKLLQFTPPAIKFLQEDGSLFRIASFGPGRALIPNAPMAFGIQDVRGYDSMILKDYVNFMEALERQGYLLQNRIDSIFDPASLGSPLLDLLNVKYVVTREAIDSPHFTLVYDGEVKIYRNESVLPRAFLVERAVDVAGEKDALRLMTAADFDPGETVVVERGPAGEATGRVGERVSGGGGDQSPIPHPPSPNTQYPLITSYTPNRVEISADAPAASYLVLSDVYYQGWRATVDGADTPILKADGAFRAVNLPWGQHTVVFEFKPFSFQLGLFAFMVASSLILLALGSVAVLRFYPRGAGSTFQRLTKNSVFPMATSLLNKLLDMGFAMYMLRILGADGAGKYAFAVVVLGYLDILANFGLGTLLTREVARDRRAANRYLGNTLVTRLVLWVLAMVVAGVLLGPLSAPLGVTPDVGLAILLLTIGLLPSMAAGTLSSLFQAYEKFEYPAGVTVLTTVFKIILGAIALGAGLGFVGLAGVSVVVNLVTLSALLGLMLAVLFRPRLEFNLRFSREMVKVSYPLMLNNLLNSLFFRMDSLMLKPIAGNVALGYYSTAYKFIDGLGIISSSFTLALFPLLSQYAQSSRESLVRTFGFALKVLLMVSLPICVGATLIAPEIILLFGGPDYLPQSAIALQILIWFLPFSFVNGVTQYLLIAINQQRFITFSFAVATAFNLAANLLLIPRFGYVGAAVSTVLSEWVLMAPFWYCVRKHLPPISLPRLFWRPVAASALMGLEVWLLRGWSLPLAVAIAPFLYGAGLLALRAFDQEELAMLNKSLPWRK